MHETATPLYAAPPYAVHQHAAHHHAPGRGMAASIWSRTDVPPLPVPQADNQDLLLAAFDALDHAVMLTGGDGTLRMANRAARRELADTRRLRLSQRRLQAAHPADEQDLSAALRAALQGRRSLLTLGAAGRALSLAVIPLGDPMVPATQRQTLVMASRERTSGRLAVQMYAHAHGATPAETEVLQALCDGLSPQQIAARSGVSLCTVRTQVLCLRSKTASPSVAHMLRKLALLPPVEPVVG